MLLKVVIVVGVVFNVLFLKGIKGEDYTVGDENRWDSQIDYGSWAAKYNFTVGDALGMFSFLFIPLFSTYIHIANDNNVSFSTTLLKSITILPPTNRLFVQIPFMNKFSYIYFFFFK